MPEGIGHVFGESGGDAAQVEEGEVEEEEVPGGVQAVVAGYGCADEAVAQEGSQVDAQQEPEVQELQLPRVCHARRWNSLMELLLGILVPGHGVLFRAQEIMTRQGNSQNHSSHCTTKCFHSLRAVPLAP